MPDAPESPAAQLAASYAAADAPDDLPGAARALRRLLVLTLACDARTLPPAVRAAREAAERAVPELAEAKAERGIVGRG